MGRTYEPSYNVAPTDLTPVLVSKHHLTEEKTDFAKRSLIPMMWGIVPRWHHKADYRNHGFHTNNVRLEGVMESRIFKQPLLEGKRCVVLCDGFYEWSTTGDDSKEKKKPYFVYAKQRDPKVRIEDRKTWPEDIQELVLLKMAGLFDLWHGAGGSEMYAYSVLTRESDDVLSWMHHRTPVVLDSEQKISDWLDYGRVGPEEALAQLEPVKELSWHSVSKQVNNSRIKLETCNKEVENHQQTTLPKGKVRITDHFYAIKKEENQ